MKLKPEHFDWLGFGAFVYILIYAIHVAYTKTLPATWATYVLLFIAVAGMIVDAVIVYRFFLMKND